MAEEQTRLIEREDWTFADADTQYMTHGFHPYPARMIPQISRKLIGMFATSRSDVILDPFVGSGGVLVEGMLHGNRGLGVDINPLAVLIAKVKTTPLDPSLLFKTANALLNSIQKDSGEGKKYSKPTYKGIDFWFLPAAIGELSVIRHHVLELEKENKDLGDFFKVCLSLSARKTSNVRNGEFKLYRKHPDELAVFKPKPFATFKVIVNTNIGKMRSFWDAMKDKKDVAVVVRQGDSKRILEVDKEVIYEGCATLVTTSPPYGDHHTTVAYGQFSRYPSLWLDLDEKKVMEVDEKGLGGTIYKKEPELDSPTLWEIVDRVRKANINRHDETRAKEVIAFFADLDECMGQVAKVLRPGRSHSCFVLGNRTVRRVQIPTDRILVELGKKYGFDYMTTKYRDIPTKTIPWVNAPENIPGQLVPTMSKETIIIWKY